MLAVMWGRVMESDDTQADASAEQDRDATPGKVLHLRTFTKVYNDYYDTLIGVVSPSAYYIMHYLVRQTWGFHRDATRSSLTAICEATKLSRHTVITGLRELEEMHIVTSDSSERGRTQVRTYQMHQPETWVLSQTSAIFALVEKQKTASAKSAPIQAATSANPALDTLQTSAKIAPILKKERRKKEEKENKSDAHASEPSANAPVPASSSKEPKKEETPEQRETRITRAIYTNDLIKRQRAYLNVRSNFKSPQDGKDRAGGNWFFTAGADGGPADPEQVIALYATIKHTSPRFSGIYLSLQDIRTYWPDWLANAANVRESLDVERRKAEYAKAAANGTALRASQSVPAAIPSTIRRFGGVDD